MINHFKNTSDAVAAVRSEARTLEFAEDYERITSWIGDASIVLLGEASHGTHEFYEARAHITRLLIENLGFSAVAIEGDWPDSYQVNNYVQAFEPTGNAADALGGFQRFPTWLWRNRTMVDFISWLRARNTAVDPVRRAGFYGLDLYSLHSSMQTVVEYLERHDPTAAQAARASYACFDQFGTECEPYSLFDDAVAQELVALREKRTAFLRQGGATAVDEFFHAEQNALLARDAERYYRTLFKGRTASWNIRDEHMADTLDALIAHLRAQGKAPKVVVWAHNSHLGDARATEMGEKGELNLGQLVRQRHNAQSKLIGLTTHSGTVIAASDWGEPAERKRVRPALPESYETIFHNTGLGPFFLPLDKGTAAGEALTPPRLERAIGVVYRPDSERLSHYFTAHLAQQFDAVIHFDTTNALEPLDRLQPAVDGDVPETFPSGL